MKTFEKKLEEQQTTKEIFPNYGEHIVIQEGKKFKRCKYLGCKYCLHHQFYTKITERGKERYEVYVCIRCEEIKGKLVHIQPESTT